MRNGSSNGINPETRKAPHGKSSRHHTRPYVPSLFRAAAAQNVQCRAIAVASVCIPSGRAPVSMLFNFNDPTIDVVVALCNDQSKLTCKYK